MLEVMLSAWTPPGVRVKFCVKKDGTLGREVVGLRGRKRIRWSRDGFCAGAAISDDLLFFPRLGWDVGGFAGNEWLDGEVVNIFLVLCSRSCSFNGPRFMISYSEKKCSGFLSSHSFFSCCGWLVSLVLVIF